MKPLPLLALAALPALAACAAEVTHPTKSTVEMQADINQCTDWANRKYWMDPVAALLNAYDCLEAKGYKRGKAFSNEVERAVHDDRVKNKQPVQPCRVPCRKRK